MSDLPGRPTWAEVDLARIRLNIAVLRGHIQPPAELMVVVKANAYGHGLVEVARASLEAGARWLGVAILEEGLALRRAGIQAPVLILGWTPREQADEVVSAGLDQTVFDSGDCQALAAAGHAAGRRARVHAKVDTGMGRLGWPARTAQDRERLVGTIQEIAGLPGLELHGVFTHFAGSDDEDLAGARAQLGAFEEVLGGLEAVGIRPRWRHCANTAAIPRLPGSHFDLCRAGIGVYGYVPSPYVTLEGLAPALSWHTRVAAVRRLRSGDAVSYNSTYRATVPEWVATLPVGYADGFARHLSNRGHVLLGGQMRPVRGRVCMDQIVVSVGEGPPPPSGEPVVLIGAQGPAARWADELAAELGTISYEVLCGISARVPRVYRGI